MRLLLRTTRGTLLLAAFVWTAGVVVLLWGLPVRPRLAWAPPERAELVGFLPDGRTVLTLDYCEPAHDLAGPLRLWDTTSGLETAAHPLTAQQMRHPLVSPDGHWLAWV